MLDGQRTRNPCTDLSTRRYPQNHPRPNRFPNIGWRQLGRTYRTGLPKMSDLMMKTIVWCVGALSAVTLLIGASKAPESQPVINGQQTIVLTSVVPTIPVTTTTIVKGCTAHVADALSAGWPASESPMIARIIMRESGCNPLAYNGRDSNGGSRGLFQINGVWCNKTKAWPNGWLQAKGLITKCDDLFYPDKNIISALAIWQHSGGWSPWNPPTLP
jgi:hypothetical protein